MSGYTSCACRDCMDIAVSSDTSKPQLCSECQEAGCLNYHHRPNLDFEGGGEFECQREDAYGNELEPDDDTYCRYCSEKISDEDPCPYHDN